MAIGSGVVPGARPAGAQTPGPGVGGGFVDPSRIGRDMMEPDRLDPRAPSPDLRRDPTPELRAPADQVVTFSAVRVEGASAFPPDRIAALFEPILNQPVPLGQVRSILDQISKMYEDGGYMFYNVVLPMQDFGKGTLTVYVIEGFISEIVVTEKLDRLGIKRRAERMMRPVIGKRPVRRRQFERHLLLLSDTPGLRLAPNVRPLGGTAQPGALALVLDGEFKRFEGIAGLDNHREVPGIGVNMTLGAIVNAPLLAGQRAEARWVGATPFHRFHLFDARFTQPLGPPGGTIQVIGQHVRERPELFVNGQRIDLLSYATNFGLRYSYPLIRSRERNLFLHAVMDITQTDIEALGTVIGGDRLRVFRGMAQYEWQGRLRSVNAAVVQVSGGTGLWGARSVCRPGADSTFVKFNFLAQRTQPVLNRGRFGRTDLVGRIAGQYALQTLPLGEVQGFGGTTFGRGFNAFEIFGDHGLSTSLEVRHTVPLGEAFKRRLEGQVFAFGDYGFVRSIERVNRFREENAASVGFGVRGRIGPRMSVEAYAAKPVLGRLGVERGNGERWRFIFRVGAQF